MATEPSPRNSSDALVVLITGCSSGIGRALVKAFAATSHTEYRFIVYATDFRLEGLDYCESLQGVHEVRTAILDVTVSDHAQALRDRIYDECGRLDILINNAGVSGVGPWLEQENDRVKRIFDINFFGPIRMIRCFAPGMIRERGGLIINTSSLLSMCPMPYTGLYCSCKAAYTSMSETIRLELQPFGVRIVTLEPGNVWTEIQGKGRADVDRLIPTYSVYDEEMMTRYPSIIDKGLHQETIVGYGPDTMPVADFVNQLVEMILKGLDQGGVFPSVWRRGANSTYLPLMMRFCPKFILDMVRRSRTGLDLLEAKVREFDKDRGFVPAKHWRGRKGKSCFCWVVLVAVVVVILLAVWKLFLSSA